MSHRTCGSSPLCTRHPIHACAPVCCVVVVFSSSVLSSTSSPLFSFQPFLMFTSEFNERSRSNPLCDFRLGTVATSDHETPLTLPPYGPLLSKAAREQEEYQQVLEVTLNLIASLGHLPGLVQELNSSTLCSVGQISRLRKIISATAPSAGTLRAHNLSLKRFLLWGADRKLSPSECFLKTTNIDVCRFHGKAGRPRFFGAKIHSIEFGLVGQNLGCACFIFTHSKYHHG